MRVGIIGMGVIGKAQARMFREHELVTYDPALDEEYPFAELQTCDFAIICVGTPPLKTGQADLQYVLAAFDQLPSRVPILLRSTVPPGTSAELGVCHAPEFMGENPSHPWQESYEVPYLILGGSLPEREFFRSRLAQVFPGEIHECSSREAEMVKYVANLYWATRVTFVNEMAHICEQFGVDYENVRRAWLRDPRMTADYLEMAGHPSGFGGRCWPKDLDAMINASANAGYVPEFLKAVREANERFV